MNRFITLAAIALLLGGLVLIGSSRYMRSAEAQGFDICIEDDSKGAALRINSTTADYIFCAEGKSYSGKGSLVKSGSIIILEHQTADRRMVARIDTSTKNGSASYQSPVGKSLGAIRDTNIADSTCDCR